MTYEERIQILDNGIIRMNTYLSYGAAYNDHLDRTGNEARQEAYDVLKKIESTQYSIYSIKNISFDSCRRNMWGHHVGEYEIQCANKCNAYIHCVNSIINILNQERIRLIKEQADEEQKSNKLLTKCTLAFSIIAALGTIASLLFTIISYFYNL